MVISLRKWWERTKYIALFILITLLAYQLLQTVESWLTPHTRFGEPGGGAVKAYAVREPTNGYMSFSERLRFFYWYGE